MESRIENTIKKIFWGLALIFCIFYFFHNYTRHHEIFGGSDEGSYIAMGKLLSQGRGFRFPDKGLLQDKQFAPPSSFLPGAFRVSKKSTPQTIYTISGWNKGYPLLSVPFWWLDPQEGWKYVNPLLAAINLLLLILVARKLGYFYGGLIAALFLAGNWLELWHARYPFTEISSQFIFLGMLYLLIRYTHERSYRNLIFLSAALCFALFVHFINYSFTIIALGTALLLILADAQSEKATSLIAQLKTHTPAILRVGFFLLIIPLLFIFLYWNWDEGIQRYANEIRASSGAGIISEGLGNLSLLEIVQLNIKNLILFIHPALPILGLFGLTLQAVKEKGVSRILWLSLLLALLVHSFIILSRGPDAVNVLYVARRQVPIVLPVLFLGIGVLFELIFRYLLSRPQAKILYRAGFAVCLLLLLVTVREEYRGFQDYEHLNKGGRTPAIGRDISRRIKSRGEFKKSYLLFTGSACGLCKSGFKYVNGIKIILPVKDAVQRSKLIRKMRKAGMRVYFMANEKQIDRLSGERYERLSFYDVLIADPNLPGPTQAPLKGAMHERIVFGEFE